MGEEACDAVGAPVVSDSNEIPGIVSSKSNNSSTRQFAVWIEIPSTDIVGSGFEVLGISITSAGISVSTSEWSSSSGGS